MPVISPQQHIPLVFVLLSMRLLFEKDTFAIWFFATISSLTDMCTANTYYVGC